MANLTSKELSAIEDNLKCEQTLICKCKNYAENCTDPQLSGKFTELANKHTEHYNKLFSLLN